MSIADNYSRACSVPSDINQHLPILKAYADTCTHITECGVRGVVSSWAFAMSLQGRPGARLVQVDLDTNVNVVLFGNIARAVGIDTIFYQQSDLECPIEPTELLFIDTWHVYGHLKRELDRWHTAVSKYIILHDTTVDEWKGETVRCGWNAVEQSNRSGIPVEEICKGLWPAIDEFLKAHPEWAMEKRLYNNNGLTILARVGK